jgi:tRNA G46 methylase TrmB
MFIKILNATLIVSFYYLIKYVSKRRLKISSYLNNYLINSKYYNKKFTNVKKSLFSSIDKNKTIFEIGCGCGSNINYYPSGNHEFLM